MYFPDSIKVVAFDADDTLWDCQKYFAAVEQAYCKILANYAIEAEISQSLFKVETQNMPLLGYGVKAFILSLVENAIKISHNQIDGKTINKVLALGKTLLNMPGTPLKGVVKTLETIRKTNNFQLIVFTKGELLDQENKLERSGLAPFFDKVIVVSNKDKAAYISLCSRLVIEPKELIMIGNSFRSDIEPVLQIGGYAIHIPYHTEWLHEVAETYQHPKLITLKEFSELIP